jgi:hypothetical protein
MGCDACPRVARRDLAAVTLILPRHPTDKTTTRRCEECHFSLPHDLKPARLGTARRDGLQRVVLAAAWWHIRPSGQGYLLRLDAGCRV